MSSDHPLLDDRYQITASSTSSPFLNVYSGTDTALNRPVVIKALTADLARQQRVAQHFLERAESAGRMSHENFIRIYDSGTGEFELSDDETYTAPYVVMEDIPTTSLRAEIVGAKLSIEDSIVIAKTMLGALEYAHRMGILHGSVNVDTVLFTTDHVLKLDNVSLALALRHGDVEQASLGDYLGEQPAIAPEYLTASSTDGRVDLYAAGAVMYEMLTGEPAFTGTSTEALLREQLQHQPLRPIIRNPFVSDVLSDIVLKALAVDPNRRFQTAAEFERAVDERQPVALVEKEASPLSMLEDRPTSLNATTTIDDLEQAALRGATLDTSAIDLPILDAPTRQERRAWKQLAFWGGGAVLLAMMIYAVLALTTRGSFDASTVSVTNVANQSQAQAIASLKQQGLGATVFTEKSNDVPVGYVIRTEPEAGIVVAKSTQVEVVVSAGKNPVTVPDLSGTASGDLSGTLQKAGLKLGQQTTVDSPTVPTGAVVNQSPVAGASVPDGSAVDVQISSGKVTIPNVKGKSYDDAINTLQDDLGFVVNPVPQYQCTGKKGRVTEQSPAPGSVDQGTSVTIKYVARLSYCK